METSLSKTLSYFLRHNPGEGNLEIDEQGFVDVDELVSLLNSKKWDNLTPEQLLDKIDDPDVERFESKGHAVRATYGHSIDVDPDYPKVDPNFPLYHGTSRGAWESIQTEGIKSQNRKYVHLSRTRSEAIRVGHRHDSSPVLLVIEPTQQSTVSFYRAGPVVLTDYVPPDWIRDHETV